jgi:hydrogenase expression/formation protein HypE
MTTSNPSLPTGKVSKDVLKRLVFTCLGAPSDRVLKGPQVGEDAALIDIGNKVLVLKSNPITSAESSIGWLAVYINANDVAVRGAKPKWYMSIILLPEGSDELRLKMIMDEQHQACSKLGVSIIGGHTEVAPGLSRPIIAGFMIGETTRERYITTGGAETGDKILLTRGAGIEGTGILATDLRDRLVKQVDSETLNRAALMLNMINVVPEALKASQVVGVHSIHTPTEGGVLNGLIEVSEAAKLGFTVYEDLILIRDETLAVCRALGVDPLKLLSSGSLLIMVAPTNAEEVRRELSIIGVESSVIGDMSSEPGKRILVKTNGKMVTVGDVAQDEVYRLLCE